MTDGPRPRGMLHKLAWYALLLVVALTPVIYKSAGSDIWRLPKTIFFEAGMLVVVSLAMLAWAFDPDWLDARRWRAELILAAAALGWCAIVTMTAVNREVSAAAPFALFPYAALFACAFLLGEDVHGPAFTALFAPALANALIMFIQVFEPRLRGPHGAELAQKLLVFGFLGNPNYAGAYLLVPVIAALAAAFAFPKRRLIYVPLVVILTAALFTAQTVTAIVALGCAMLAFAFVSRSRALRAAAVVSVVLVIVAALAWAPTRNRAKELVSAVREHRYVALSSERLPAFAVAMKMFSERPLLGVGPGGFAARYMTYRLDLEEQYPQWITGKNINFAEVHNDHLQLLAESGVPGYLLFLALLWRLARISWQRDRDDFARLFALPASVGFAVLALGLFPLELTAVAVPALFIAASTMRWGSDAAA